MNKKIKFGAIFSVILISILIFSIGLSNDKPNDKTSKLYKVYLDGKELGMIQNQNELYALINNEQQEIKEKYEVEKIYPPKGLEISEIITYDKSIISANDIYDKIKNNDTFTIEGYQISINNVDNKPVTFNVLKQEYFDEAVKNITESFVGKEKLLNYLDGNQEEITDEGEIIDKIYLDDNVSIKKTLISTNDYIFTSSSDLTRFLLFGTLEDQKTYTVKYGDTLENIADNNYLNIIELLIANPDIVSENILLYSGQKLNIGLINPQLKVVEETTSIENQKIKYETTVQYDKRLQAGISYVKQAGSNGLSRVTYKNQIVNGETTKVVQLSVEEITPAINQIVVVGGTNIVYVGDSTYWAWPTTKPYRITSGFKWRWGKMHRGIDITSSGHGSPIYAIQSGKVRSSGYESSMGNYVWIDHQNGYKSVYMHMTKRLVSKGETVVKGQTIGLMGSTGNSTGTHLHLGVTYNGTYINPLTIYEK